MKLFQFVSVFGFVVLVIILTSCSKKPQEINYNSDECDYCTMQIRDNRFAAEIINGENKVYKFDSIECLIGFALAKNILDDKSLSLFVCDYQNPGNFIEARNSFFTHNENFTSPMGLNVQAFSSESECEKFMKENGGKKLKWDDVVKMAKES
jgi:copper chaperone NosL